MVRYIKYINFTEVSLASRAWSLVRYIKYIHFTEVSILVGREFGKIHRVHQFHRSLNSE